MFGTTDVNDHFSETWERILAQEDENNDGQISFEEFKHAMSQALKDEHTHPKEAAKVAEEWKI